MTICAKQSGAIGEPGTAQAISSRTMQPRSRLVFLSTGLSRRAFPKKRTHIAFVFAFALSTGCATAVQKHADGAFERGDYVAAADLYDQAVREKPGSGRLIAKRWDARAKSVAELARRTQAQRHAGKELSALALARATIEAKVRWFSGADRGRLSSETHHEVDELSEWAIVVVSRSVRSQLDAQKPLAAHHALKDARGLFEVAGLASRFETLAHEVTAAGAARCGELKTRLTEGRAHLSFIVAAYCRTFSTEAPPVPADRDQIGSLRIQANTLSPTTREQRARLEARLEELLTASPWFHASAQGMAAASISGSHTATFSEARAQREAQWVEQVSYQMQEFYQDPYYTTEFYMEQEPYTEYRSESYSCGYGKSSQTCTRSVPHISYRSVQKSRHVLRYYTKSRTVTRYRPEPRIFHYEVTEHRAAYTAAWDIALTFAPSVPQLIVPVRGAVKATADQHDVTFASAGVKPATAKLMGHDQWFDDRLKALDADFPKLVRTHWLASYCAAQSLDDEQAARCARGAREDTPTHAQAVLDGFLHDEVKPLLATR